MCYFTLERLGVVLFYPRKVGGCAILPQKGWGRCYFTLERLGDVLFYPRKIGGGAILP